MRLFSQELVRLYAVSEKEKFGKFALKEFGKSMNAFNESIDKDELGETLVDLANALWGESSCHRCFEVTDEMAPKNKENGRRHIYDNDARFEFRDIVDKIGADPDRCQFFVMIDADRTDLCWVAAMQEGTVYSD